MIVLGLAGVPAAAAIQTVPLAGVSFYDTPYTYDFGAGNTITFTTVDRTFFAYNPAGVSTGGTVQIASFGAPFYDPPQPTSYFTNRGGSFGPGANITALFLSYATPAAVPYSISEGLVGLRFDLGRGYQYGYADIAGSTLYGLRFQTTPGLALPFGAVPEPAAWALMVVGFGLVGAATRRRQAVPA
ncbi:MAG: PEP-CTERM sorting domain-containing protein [Sphingomonadaceae bacterium]|nr:PEP-CTERM sorting domain-containing protein [Sphingomonadaceae bacterium]